MQNSDKKQTEVTVNSPTHSRRKTYHLVPKKSTQEQAISVASRRSKYSSKSELTHSQVFQTLSRANPHSKR